MTPRNPVTEAQLLRGVTELAMARGWMLAHHHDSRRQVRPGVFVGDKLAAGLPDLVLVKPPRLLFVELKAQHGRLSPLQRDWLQALEQVPGVEVYLWRPEQLDDGTVWRVLGGS